jgi:hypothetical protein
MARVLPELPGMARRGAPKYEWEKFFDGQVWELTAGEDFKGDAEHFRSSIHGAASRFNVSVRTRILDGGRSIALQASDKSAGDEAA